jgi:hypothetical protein
MRVFAAGSSYSDAEKETITTKVEAFNLRWVLAGNNAQILENLYQKLANDNVDTGAPYTAHEILQELAARTPVDEEVIVKFRAEAKSAKQTKLILFRIEQELGLEEAYDSKNVSIEYIAPVKDAPGSDFWIKKLFPGEPEAMDLEYETTISQWGNQTIVEKPVPNAAKAADFAEKVNGNEDYLGYLSSKFAITRGLSAVEDWDRFSIRARNEWIGQAVLDIWPVDGPSKKPQPFAYSQSQMSEFPDESEEE